MRLVLRTILAVATAASTPSISIQGDAVGVMTGARANLSTGNAGHSTNTVGVPVPVPTPTTPSLSSVLFGSSSSSRNSSPTALARLTAKAQAITPVFKPPFESVPRQSPTTFGGMLENIAARKNNGSSSGSSSMRRNRK